MYLRSADLLDASDLARLRAASLIELGIMTEPRGPRFVAEATRQYVRLFREERMAAWVLVSGGVVAGCACVVYYDRLPYPDGVEHAEIAGVYVAPEHRGAGIASELVRETIASVRATFLRPSSEASRRLYARLGFTDMPFMRLEETIPADSRRRDDHVVVDHVVA